jgi:2,3-bisphosphoglycerate-dependent phosphoglycerate mutase
MPLAMNLTLMTRHGRSVFNVAGVVNGDPELDRGLDPSAIPVCEALSTQIAAIQIDLCVVSRFPRAQQTADLALGDRIVPRVVDPDLDDIKIGELEGKPLAAYRDWKHGRTRDDPFPGGESLNDAARRYAGAYERLLARPEGVLLVVCHEIPLRYAVNAAAGSADLDAPLHDVPNATPYLFDPAGLRRAVDRIRELARNA